jgi:hypothetical protein
MAVAAKNKAKMSLLWTAVRITLVIFVVLRLDGETSWSYWLIFLPFWIVSCCVCCLSCVSVASVNTELMALDEEMGEGAEGCVRRRDAFWSALLLLAPADPSFLLAPADPSFLLAPADPFFLLASPALASPARAGTARRTTRTTPAR